MAKQHGFVQIIIIIVLLVVILSLLGVSLSSLFSNPLLKDNFGFIGNWLSSLWNNYLAASAYHLWNILKEVIWNPFVETMRGLASGVNPFVK
ncbi:hypothetical protein A2W54_04380 [Candidatus Giovannonibacteria bacterium RIFCSPHIGHO2_02_43_13]|uniref:Uncharacterized protein n=1 Tax=Candidatus Giovannonibacteria bacterium RIFCSPHIGHO2_02_43_13 TaxID=1798330 RepID=A0A1F5WRL0_9BACT|nr:MAG: hypothetical protein UW28_C0013G0061 [Parcubacteria group bacterium GW2011_GWA2_44_13]OGF74683.1 MAG: hypothetical protein A3E06_03120 [Candidatus Giovannonibacteria bacterium RIFCSPHIGHO2_12_FULL_44_42]OGF78299.1 MAG: hypothetical protein A2W54_04380 [Candidatus Giovannonibacteria bacterium RIFCSPHIGHO2_02_43_13]OGF89548.1 MAG: hypothetical protein A3I94_03415 [Candidatus Giovannonibacteria bacterium RIFCSPLOWO2_02_FULL_43_54]OGF96645.1 MAG: hypothetical protein A3H08_01765 [Candidatus